MGMNDSHSPWALESFNLFKQLAISFGVLNPCTTPDPHMPVPLNASEDTIDLVALVVTPTLSPT